MYNIRENFRISLAIETYEEIFEILDQRRACVPPPKGFLTSVSFSSSTDLASELQVLCDLAALHSVPAWKLAAMIS